MMEADCSEGLLVLNRFDDEMTKALSAAKRLGLGSITPAILSNGANLILHLYPYPIVARLATASVENSSLAYRLAEREIVLARYLDTKGIPVLKPAGLVPAGPHDADGAWMTLWDFITPMKPNRPAPEEAFLLVARLKEAMQGYPGELPTLGIWNRAVQSAVRLEEQSDTNLRRLLRLFHHIDGEMRSGAQVLQPCHGDAHAGNLLSGPDGWIWIDFEDASLMPPYWDMASYTANLALFGGRQEPTYKWMQKYAAERGELADFHWAIKARILISTLGNMDFALRGRGDLIFATRQLELAVDFLNELGD